ncbi:hypothetical protein [Magnetospirillum aberrantis]|uniref:Fibronectin type-III domain-containing protein n=1 Tax=Magnetospirillum aberrantis SpK TaxID=908842 RepID=A0A7C9UVF3_9PROT|nr:hypothetical protein [Magnetospirillum aberrantis]NFV79989.1 hypothetical protein [Magnetospirillum aberrantis SpK]
MLGGLEDRLMGGGGGGIVKSIIVGAILGAATGGIGFGLGLTAGSTSFLGFAVSAMEGAILSGAAMGAIGGTLSGVAGALLGSSAVAEADSFRYEASDRTHSMATAIGYRRLIYGRIRVAGQRTFVHVTNDNKTLHVVYTIAAHEVDGFEEFWLNEEVIPFGTDGKVTAGDWKDKVEVTFGLGTTEGDATFHEKLRAACPGKWTESHLQAGCAKVYVKFTYDSSLFASGIPNPSWVVRGKKVFDPRTGATAWSDNPTLCQRDYMVEWWGWKASRIGTADCIASANIDDEEVETSLVRQVSQVKGTAIGTMTGGGGLNAAFDGSDDDEWEDCATGAAGATIGRVETTARAIAGIRFVGSIDNGICDSASTFTWAVEGSNDDGATWATIYTSGTVNDEPGLVVEVTSGFSSTTSYLSRRLVINADSGSVGVAEVRFYEAPGVEKRYTCNGSVLLSTDHGTIMKQLLSANRGVAVDSGGKWRLMSAAWRTPHARELTEDDLDGGIQLEPRLTRKELFNTVAGVYTNPDSFWQAEDFPTVWSDFYRTEDGPQALVTAIDTTADTITVDETGFTTGQPVRVWSDDVQPGGIAADTVYFVILTATAGTIKLAASHDDAVAGTAVNITSAGSGTIRANFGVEIDKDVELPFTTSPATCQRIVKIDLLRCRQQQRITWPGKLTCFPYRADDIIPVTLARYGWTRKYFEIEAWAFAVRGGDSEDDAPRLGIDMVLRETDESCFDWSTDEEQLVDPAPDTGLPKARVVMRPSVPTLSSGTDRLLVLGDGTIISRLHVAWTDPDDASLYRIQVQLSADGGATWADQPDVLPGVQEAYLSPVVDGTDYLVRLRAVNQVGAVSKWRASEPHALIGKTARPADLLMFTVSDGVARWEAEAEKDFEGIEIRYHVGVNRSFATALPLHQGRLASSPYTLPGLPGGVVTILAKGFDTSGNESIAASSVVLNLGDILVGNVVEEYDLMALGWPGIIINGSVDDDGTLVADDAGGLAWDANEGRLAWTNDAAPAWTGSWKAMTYEVDVEFPLAVGADTIKLPLAVEGGSVIIEVRRPSAGLAWTNDAAGAWSGDDAAPAWGVEPWEPWTGDMPARPGTWGFRVTTGFGATRGRIATMTPTLDGADISEVLQGVTLAPEGTRLPIANTYRAVKVVVCNLIGGTAATVRTVDKDTSGPLVRADDASGAGISATVDATIQGY